MYNTTNHTIEAVNMHETIHTKQMRSKRGNTNHDCELIFFPRENHQLKQVTSDAS